MKVYRPILVALTLLVTILISTALIGSWTEPQAQSQLNLYQSDLLLHASEWEQLTEELKDAPSLRNSFLGESPVKDALKNYEAVRKSAQAEFNRLKLLPKAEQPAPASPSVEQRETDPDTQSVLRSPRQSKGQFLEELDIRIGLLQAKTGQRDQALKTWTQMLQPPQTANAQQQPTQQQSIPQQTAQILRGLWSDPPEIFPEAESILNQNLTGWFRFESLSKLYQLQQRQDALVDLRSIEQETAQNAFLRLLAVGVMPVLGSAAGIGILLLWGLRTFLFQRDRSRELKDSDAKATRTDLTPKLSKADGNLSKDSSEDLRLGAIANLAPDNLAPDNLSQTASPAPQSSDPAVLQSSVLWPTETIWQVMVLWFTAFFGVSFFLVPLSVALLRLKPEVLDGRFQAYLSLFSYGCLMAAGFGILQLSLRRYVPNVFRWLSVRLTGNWFAWGLGGYFVALPLVLIISLLNQQILKDQGGGNPILEIILKSEDGFTIGLLWFLVAVCAPVFEETLFRGFFLTSLTRYLPTWQAIGLSGVVFAIAHLNLGDLLPLSLLGMVLGFVYLRSRNLLASILLHSLWNSGSFVSLLILGGGS
ncbi:MAG: CPBP family intramembrane metalloprotease [Thermosynechococcaceae cyanobacterium MS004]|nr:CPBP family intramembrane metalloprotease [Thermosynechococcaceae cyanobacterium MS004]